MISNLPAPAQALSVYLSLFQEFCEEVTNFRIQRFRLGGESPDPLFSDFLRKRGLVELANLVRLSEAALSKPYSESQVSCNTESRPAHSFPGNRLE